jgi:hypothetical protein
VKLEVPLVKLTVVKLEVTLVKPKVTVVKYRSETEYWNFCDRQTGSTVGGPVVSNHKVFAPIVFCS